MKYFYKIWLWFEHIFDIKWTRKHTLVLVWVLTGLTALGIFFVAYKNIAQVRSAQVSAQRKQAQAQRVSTRIKEIEQKTFADEMLSVDDAIFNVVQKNPDLRTAQRYMTYVASMYNQQTVQKARVAIPWDTPQVSKSFGVSDETAYTSKIATAISVAKTYGSGFETYIGQFDVTATATNGNKLTTKSVVTLTFSSGKVVSWSLSERNLQ